jgi:pimeloyl-ACP methyl ester carboxylesterase
MTNLVHDRRRQVNGLDFVLEGDGPLTAVFENGLATPLEEWDPVVPRIAARARVLRYDHRYAEPQGASAPRSVSGILDDLEGLLRTLDLEPPYVFVGHSWGGVIARLFAHMHPSEVVGLVLVDATHEAIDLRALSAAPRIYSLMLFLARARFVRRALSRQLCPAGASPAYRARVEQRLNDPVRWPTGLRTAQAESAAIVPALVQLRHDCPDLPSIPVRVLTGGEKSKMAQRAREGWQTTVARSPRAQYTNVPSSSHYMPIDHPDMVADAILSVLVSARHT